MSTAEEERKAMCDEIARMVGFMRQERKPGWVSIKEYAAHLGLTDTSARRHLEGLVLQGKLSKEWVMIGNRHTAVYGKE